MEHEIIDLFTSLQIPKTHVTVGLSNLLAANKQYKSLFVNRRLPDEGWSDIQIQHFLMTLASLDTNHKTPGNSSSSSRRWCGVGEREGRVYSNLVLQRHLGFTHGMGRSGDVTEPQPKAVGSSVLVKLTLWMVLDAIQRGSGLKGKHPKNLPHENGPASFGVLLPLCTGMSMALVLSSLRVTAAAAAAAAAAGTETATPPKENQETTTPPPKDIVLWSRIDQKSCFKAIQSAGLTCVVVPTKLDGDEVTTDLENMEQTIKKYGSTRILAIVTTTSCFVPRSPDRVDEVAKLCGEHNIAHVVNHAYGLQCTKTNKLINRACVVGRVDAVVCSTDKNFLVPVGGALVISPTSTLIQTVSKTYAGRASSTPLVDLFMTLLSMGFKGYQELLTQRMKLTQEFQTKLAEIATKHNERILHCPSNTISYGITLDSLALDGKGKMVPNENTTTATAEEKDTYLKSISKDISYFGSILFNRCVSGTRVVPRGEVKQMGNETFSGFGSSTNSYPHAYMTAACAIGLEPEEMNDFFQRLDKSLKEYKTKQKKKYAKQLKEEEEEPQN